MSLGNRTHEMESRAMNRPITKWGDFIVYLMQDKYRVGSTRPFNFFRRAYDKLVQIVQFRFR